jgi:5'-3' exonuclease
VWQKFGKPHETALVFTYDAVGSSESRRELYPRYKKRKRQRKLPGGLTAEEVREDIFGLISHLPCYLLGGPGYEADDYIAAVTKTFKERDHLVVTRDVDLWALIKDKVHVLGKKRP